MAPTHLKSVAVKLIRVHWLPAVRDSDWSYHLFGLGAVERVKQPVNRTR
jgi:hypothetical protein